MQLEKSDQGCYVEQCFAGAIVYADDLHLLSGLVKKLQLMLDLSYEFGIKCDLVFTIDKSYCGLIGRLYSGIFSEFFISGKIIFKSDSIVYLVVTFKFGLQLSVDFSDRCRKFMASVSSVLRHKVIGYEQFFSEILIIKCLPVLNYGVDCVYLGSYSSNVINKCWSTAFNRNKFESTRLLFYACKTMSMKFLLDLKHLCLVHNIFDSGTMLLRRFCRFAWC